MIALIITVVGFGLFALMFAVAHYIELKETESEWY